MKYDNLEDGKLRFLIQLSLLTELCYCALLNENAGHHRALLKHNQGKLCLQETALHGEEELGRGHGRDPPWYCLLGACQRKIYAPNINVRSPNTAISSLAISLQKLCIWWFRLNLKALNLTDITLKYVVGSIDFEPHYKVLRSLRNDISSFAPFCKIRFKHVVQS